VAFLNGIEGEKKRQDSFAILDLMKQVTGKEPKMWEIASLGLAIITTSMRAGGKAICLIGFSPRKQNLTLYIMSGFNKYDELLKNLGKYKTGKACLYINKIEDIDLQTLGSWSGFRSSIWSGQRVIKMINARELRQDEIEQVWDRPQRSDRPYLLLRE
jgi:hypothetical protein